MGPDDIQDLIYANHILHYHHVVDAYGHKSLRHPDKADIFLMSGDRAPALVSSATGLIEYHISDASPVDPQAKKGYLERFIHSEIYKGFPHVNSVIHSHSEAVMPYTMSGAQMKPSFHIAETEVPSFDITPLYEPIHNQDFLINSVDFGAALASKFSAPDSSALDHNVVPMANHGFTTVLGRASNKLSIEPCILMSMLRYSSKAIMLNNAASENGRTGELRYLNETQTKGSLKMNEASQERPWGLWVREVEFSPLYANEEKKRPV